MGCPKEEALSFTLVLLYPSEEWVRPEGVADPVQRKPLEKGWPVRSIWPRGDSPGTGSPPSV